MNTDNDVLFSYNKEGLDSQKICYTAFHYQSLNH